MDEQLKEQNRKGVKTVKPETTIVLTSKDKKDAADGATEHHKKHPKVLETVQTSLNTETKEEKHTIVLTSKDKKDAADRATEQQKKYLKVLETVGTSLNSVPSYVFETKLRKAAKLVASLGKQHPLIKWNLSLLFHTAAGETGLTAWETELLLQKCRWGAVVGDDVLGRLGVLCAP